jgi:hypothetical protein
MTVLATTTLVVVGRGTDKGFLFFIWKD